MNRPTVRRAFKALGTRNYRLYFIGQATSVSGTWMQTIALTWLVLRLGGNGLVLGLTAALQYLPLLILGPFAGVVVDRVDKRRLLFVTQSTAAALALVLGVLTMTDTIRLPMVLTFAVALGFVNAFDIPARQTFALELVGPALLPNAITLNSVTMNLGRLVGPAIAGLVIAIVGLGPCFILNATTYVTLLMALLLMDTSALVRTPRVPRQPRQLREGFAYVRRTPAVRTPLIVMALVGTFTYEFQVMLPLLARETFGSDASGFSFLMSAMALGSVIGGLIGAAVLRPSARRLGIAGLVLGALTIVASLMPSLALTGFVLVFVGAASITFITLSNSTLQLTADPEMRGRVIALFAMAFLGSIPIGGPIMGWLAQSAGPRVALFCAGAIAIIVVAVGWRALSRIGDIDARPLKRLTTSAPEIIVIETIEPDLELEVEIKVDASAGRGNESGEDDARRAA